MGAGHHIACITCQKDYYLGYGSFSLVEQTKLPKFASSSHSDHNLFRWNDDSFSIYTGEQPIVEGVEAGDLIIDDRPEFGALIKNFDMFERIDLSGVVRPVEASKE